MKVTRHNAWHAPSTPRTSPPRSGWTHRLHGLARMALSHGPAHASRHVHPATVAGPPPSLRRAAAPARAVERRFWEDLDFTEADLVIVPGFGGAAKVLAHPTFRPGTRILAVDFHMLDGVEALAEPGIAEGRRIAQGGWWPTPICTSTAAFRDTPASIVPVACPCDRCTGVLSGVLRPLHHGSTGPRSRAHLRGWTSLPGLRHPRDRRRAPRAATAHRGPRRSRPEPARRGPLRLRGTTRCPTTSTQRTSRFVVLPILHDATRAAGITAISLAFSAGRPVIATRTGATQDHLRHETDALLVPPHDPDALARAIRRLAHDDDLVKHLARGVQRARRQFHVSSWADEIVDGASTQTAVPHEGGTWRTW